MIYHHSRESFYRSPGGAAVRGDTITLRLRATGYPLSVILRTWFDGREEKRAMASVGFEVFETALPLPDACGNLWYHFIVDYGRETAYYGNAADGFGGEGETYASEPPGYQITIYDPSFETPEWMREGILYQAMVDRFCPSKPARMRKAPEGGIMHLSWDEPPSLTIENGDNAANDFFGGDLPGLQSKLPYLARIGVTALYLNPIFEARSNHKYNTGDYHAIDPAFGSTDDFRALCEAAKALGIRVVLDGVFSHTGADSRYFNREGAYDSVGAYQSEDSPYHSWYSFRKWPDEYDCWWGFASLPNVNEMDSNYLDFIIRSDDAVAAHWLKMGASGWRLDVADELPMAFLRLLRGRVKAFSPDSALIGEVWEDASNKITYGETRNYCLGDTLDSAMNYPLRDALVAFMLGKSDAARAARVIESMGEKYPKPVFYSLMNLLGSHDKPRIISILADAGNVEPARAERRVTTLTDEQYALGRRRYLAAWRFIASLPGMPSIYYADEAGAQGMADPFCRGTYPWQHEDRLLLDEITRINHSRLSHPALKTGAMRLYAPSHDVLVCVRKIDGGKDVFGNPHADQLIITALNRADTPAEVTLPADGFIPVQKKLSIPRESAITA